MRVLVGCESSGIVREAFRKLGHDAWSCDLLPTEIPGQHFKCDVRKVIRKHYWDLFIVHPDCTYLCSSGLHWNKRRPGRALKTEKALEFVQEMLDAPVDKIVLENSRGCIGTRIRPYDQTIQPWEFGHPESKTTDLWLKSLPLLKPTKILHRPAWVRCECCEDFLCTIHGMHAYDCPCPDIDGWARRKIDPYTDGGRWDNQTPSGQNKLGPSEDRWKARARTYPGIAKAMAKQWGGRA